MLCVLVWSLSFTLTLCFVSSIYREKREKKEKNNHRRWRLKSRKRVNEKSTRMSSKTLCLTVLMQTNEKNTKRDVFFVCVWSVSLVEVKTTNQHQMHHIQLGHMYRCLDCGSFRSQSIRSAAECRVRERELWFGHGQQTSIGQPNNVNLY